MLPTSMEKINGKSMILGDSVTVFLSGMWHIWSPRPNSVPLIDWWYIVSRHVHNAYKWCLYCLIMILSRLVTFKPNIFGLTGTSPDSDEHPNCRSQTPVPPRPAQSRPDERRSTRAWNWKWPGFSDFLLRTITRFFVLKNNYSELTSNPWFLAL